MASQLQCLKVLVRHVLTLYMLQCYTVWVFGYVSHIRNHYSFNEGGMVLDGKTHTWALQVQVTGWPLSPVAQFAGTLLY